MKKVLKWLGIVAGTLVLAIAVGGGMINFELIAYPMSQMVEG